MAWKPPENFAEMMEEFELEEQIAEAQDKLELEELFKGGRA